MRLSFFLDFLYIYTSLFAYTRIKLSLPRTWVRCRIFWRVRHGASATKTCKREEEAYVSTQVYASKILRRYSRSRKVQRTRTSLLSVWMHRFVQRDKRSRPVLCVYSSFFSRRKFRATKATSAASEFLREWAVSNGWKVTVTVLFMI